MIKLQHIITMLASVYTILTRFNLMPVTWITLKFDKATTFNTMQAFLYTVQTNIVSNSCL